MTIIILSLIGGLRSFDLIWAMTRGGPGFTTDVIASVIYKQYQAGCGLSTAGNVVLFVVVSIVIVPLWWAQPQKDRAVIGVRRYVVGGTAIVVWGKTNVTVQLTMYNFQSRFRISADNLVIKGPVRSLTAILRTARTRSPLARGQPARNQWGQLPSCSERRRRSLRRRVDLRITALLVDF